MGVLRQVWISCPGAGGVLQRRAVVPLAVGVPSAGTERGARPAAQGAAAVLLRESPPHPDRHLGARLLPALPGPHQAVCAHLQLTGHQSGPELQQASVPGGCLLRPAVRNSHRSDLQETPVEHPGHVDILIIVFTIFRLEYLLTQRWITRFINLPFSLFGVNYLFV